MLILYFKNGLRKCINLYSTEKLSSGNYRVRILDYVDYNNKRHYKSFTGATPDEAIAKANEYDKTNDKQKKTKPYNELLLCEAYERYISSKSAILSPSTIAGYKRYSVNYLQSIMRYKLKNLSQELIQIAINELSISHSPKTVRNCFSLLSSVLKTYMPNLKLNVSLPRKITPEYVIPTTEEIRTLLNNSNELIKVPILLAAFGSLRRSEVCALTPPDVFENGINVNKAAVYNNEGKIIIKAPKTRAGRRFVPMSKEMISEVKEWKYFNCSPSTIDSNFNKLVKQCAVPKFSFHKLRHYFASELHARGVPDKEIARIGGWETMDTLHNIYQHSMRDKQKEFDIKVTNIFQSNYCPSEGQ